MSEPSRKRKPTLDELRDWMRWTANNTRDTADEMAAMHGGCDDPAHPWDMALSYRDWLDFTEQVCRPIVEAEGDEAMLQKAMLAYRRVCPYYIAAALVMAANRVNTAGAEEGGPMATNETDQ